jgi:DNA-binding transcriptional regulator GbsR (MarR family)
MTKVTERQNEYMLALEAEPKTAKELMASLGVKKETVDKTVLKLMAAGLVTSKKEETRKTKTYGLVKPYSELQLEISGKMSVPVREEEIFYAAILRNAGMTGQELKHQHEKVFAERGGRKSVAHIVGKARGRGLC